MGVVSGQDGRGSGGIWNVRDNGTAGDTESGGSVVPTCKPGFPPLPARMAVCLPLIAFT